MSNLFLEDMYEYWRLYAKDKVVEMKETEIRKKEMESMSLNDFIKRQYEKTDKRHWYHQQISIEPKETFDSRKSELATESIPIIISEDALTLTLPEGTEVFKGQIHASNGVLYKISLEKAEE